MGWERVGIQVAQPTVFDDKKEGEMKRAEYLSCSERVQCFGCCVCVSISRRFQIAGMATVFIVAAN